MEAKASACIDAREEKESAGDSRFRSKENPTLSLFVGGGGDKQIWQGGRSHHALATTEIHSALPSPRLAVSDGTPPSDQAPTPTTRRKTTLTTPLPVTPDGEAARGEGERGARETWMTLKPGKS
jgi:hypothetical protein